MAVSIAKMVVGSKVKQFGQGVEGAIGLDEEEGESQAAADMERKAMSSEVKRQQERRKREKELYHQEKEVERKHIRDKYQLPDRSKARPAKEPPTSSASKPSKGKKDKCSVS